MSQQISVHLLPILFEPEGVRGGTAVIVDILRATTTMSFALANGAACVVPCSSVQDAMSLRERQGKDACLLGGERGGIKIDGFDLSNSPDDYSADVVTGKTIGFTTTNGTKALLRAGQAESILIAAFANLSAVVARLRDTKCPIHIICAGTNGAITGEDVLFAGALTARLMEVNSDSVLSDSALMAINHWRQECGRLSNDAIETSLRRSQGGRNLIALGYDKDIATAAMIDTVHSIGCMDESGVLRIE